MKIAKQDIRNVWVGVVSVENTEKGKAIKKRELSACLRKRATLCEIHCRVNEEPNTDACFVRKLHGVVGLNVSH